MHVKFLVGKNAIRTNPVKTLYGMDESYTRRPLFIVKVTESHIVVKNEKQDERIHILTKNWIDENWVDYDELIKVEEGEMKNESNENNN